MRIVAAILAGGKASRLGGVAKGLLRDDTGVPLIQRLIDQFAAAGIARVILSVNHNPQAYAQFGKPLVADLHPDAGPLGGIEAALNYLKQDCDSVFFTPCDLPAFSASEIHELLRAHGRRPERIVMAGTREGEHPLCAVVPVAILPAVSLAIGQRRCGVNRLWRELGVLVVTMEETRPFLNINGPEDLDGWRPSPGGAAANRERR
jgi:molybdenum cofactor guanylyltransferase